MNRTKTLLNEKLQESLRSVLPVSLIVLALCFSVAPVPAGLLLSFLLGAVMLVAGMGLFTLGADLSMSRMGEFVGVQMTRSRKLSVIVTLSAFVGVMITLSEPDLQVLAGQVPTIPNLTLILSVSAGVGAFLVLAMLRVLLRIRLQTLLVGFYVLAFVLATLFVKPEFWAVAFDSGGVTTGPMTVPFIMSLGVGISSIRSDERAEDDSFGMVALCSVGPILAVLILGMIFNPEGAAYTPPVLTDAADSRAVFWQFIVETPRYLREVAAAMGPIVVFFLIYQHFTARMTRQRLTRLLVGVAYTYLGLVLFLTGVNVGFMPLGNYLGSRMGSLRFSALVIPVGMLIGYFIVAAEPAVHVLTRQVDELTAGMIPKQSLRSALGLGVSVSVGLAMIRVLTGVSILWLLIPGYAIALGLTFVVPKLFVSIAFDSGGVASGTMTATFLLPFAIGVCQAVGGNVVTDAFGVVAMVAMTPLIAIQILGLIYRTKLQRAQREALPNFAEEEIIDV